MISDESPSHHHHHLHHHHTQPAGCTGAHRCTALLSGFTPLYFANDTVALSTFGERERKRTARADINNTSTHAGSELLQTHGVSGTGTKLEQDGKRNKGWGFLCVKKAGFFSMLDVHVKASRHGNVGRVKPTGILTGCKAQAECRVESVGEP